MIPLSIIMPVRNHSEYLHESIESILSQTFTDFEFLIIDDGSKDRSNEIINDFASKDKRIKCFFNQTPKGVTAALNFLINKSNSNIIARQDADDMSRNDRLFIQINKINNFELVSSNYYTNNNDNSILIKKNDSHIVMFFKNLFYYYLGAHGQIVFKKRFYDEKFKFCQDYKLFSDIMSLNKTNIHVVQQPLYFYRKHKNSVYNYHRKKQLLLSLKISQQNIKNILGLNVSLHTVNDLREFFINSKLPALPLTTFNLIVNKITNIFKEKHCLEHEKPLIDNFIRETYSQLKS